MINVVATSEVKAEHLDYVKEQIKILVAETNKEKGCIQYNAYFKEDNLASIFFVEQWENQEAFDSHINSNHIKEYRTKTADMFISKNINFLSKI